MPAVRIRRLTTVIPPRDGILIAARPRQDDMPPDAARTGSPRYGAASR
ncbi:hypothetical protein F4557_006893 [Actinomadura catellatispora]|uniref:Uncharacterized protein n=1 Tax=Actinomadura livida TaxID=79909 RepID=A0A7W7N1Z5_9ACTN|nr:hypothetical protein [Actinomadura catellatispora]